MCCILFQFIDQNKLIYSLTFDFNFHWLGFFSPDVIFGFTAVQSTIREAGRLYKVDHRVPNVLIIGHFQPTIWSYWWVGLASADQWKWLIFFHFKAVCSIYFHIFRRIWNYTSTVVKKVYSVQSLEVFFFFFDVTKNDKFFEFSKQTIRLDGSLYCNAFKAYWVDK